MTESTVTTKTVDPIRVARVTGRTVGTGHVEIGPLPRQLFDRLLGPIMRQQVAIAGPPVVTYQPTAEGGLTVTACCPVGADTAAGAGPELGERPGLERVAALLHRGSMAGVGATYGALERWVAEQGLNTDGTAREVYLVSVPEPEERWQTEVQLPIT